MKSFKILFLFIIFLSFFSKTFSQSNQPIVKAWVIEEEIFGGAPPPKNQKPLDRKTIRVFMETLPNSGIKIVAVWIRKKPYSVHEEMLQKNSMERNYKPDDVDVNKLNFIQAIATGALPFGHIKVPKYLFLGNEAVIVYSSQRKKINYYAVKRIEIERINLP